MSRAGHGVSRATLYSEAGRVVRGCFALLYSAGTLSWCVWFATLLLSYHVRHRAVHCQHQPGDSLLCTVQRRVESDAALLAGSYGPFFSAAANHVWQLRLQRPQRRWLRQHNVPSSRPALTIGGCETRPVVLQICIIVLMFTRKRACVTGFGGGNSRMLA